MTTAIDLTLAAIVLTMMVAAIHDYRKRLGHGAMSVIADALFVLSIIVVLYIVARFLPVFTAVIFCVFLFIHAHGAINASKKP